MYSRVSDLLTNLQAPDSIKNSSHIKVIMHRTVNYIEKNIHRLQIIETNLRSNEDYLYNCDLSLENDISLLDLGYFS